MPIVNYVAEHRRFIEFASDERLTANERLLWYALMHIFNQRAEGNVWPGEFIRVSNDRVLTYCPMRFDSMAKARNGLKQAGLIDFKAGNKNKEAPAYKMNYFYPDGYPVKTDNIRDITGDNTGDNNGDNMGDNPWGNMGDNIINLNNSLKKNGETHTERPSASFARAGEGFDNGWRTSEKARGAVAQRILNQFRGVEFDPDAHRKVLRLLEMGMNPELLAESIAHYMDMGEWLDWAFQLARKAGMEEDENQREERRIRRDCERASGGNQALADALYRMEMRARETEASEG